jgi:nucleoside-diphosphate-sugar epimerase
MKRLLIVGCGDIARRALPGLLGCFEVSALTRSGGAEPGSDAVRWIGGDLDRPETLGSLAGIADCVLHSAPPQDSGQSDRRTLNLLAALDAGAMLPRRIVYLSTSGVYGDCHGAQVDEAHALSPHTDRARRRADAEAQLAGWCARRSVALVILRVPGIYAADRLPVERLRSGTPALRTEDDVFTNHIHADDLADIVRIALQKEDVQGVFNASDDSDIRMADYFDLVADRCGLPRPARVSRQEALRRLPPALLSFMSESRRLSNRRMKEILGVQLRYPTVHDGVPRAELAA